jgi:hypothetical protein
MLEMHNQDGSSLSLGWELYRQIKPQVFHSFPFIRYRTNITIKVGLGIVWISLLIDSIMSWKYVSLAGEDTIIYLMGATGICAFFLFMSIGVLLIVQVNSAMDNVTTLESFIPRFD